MAAFLLSRLGELFHRKRRDQELATEIESHLQLHIEDNLRSGMTPVEARRQALIKFGGMDSTVEAYRERRSFSFGGTVLQDLRYAVRILKKNPGFTAAALMAIALGVGINVGIFSVLNGAALRPLPVRRAEQVVSVYQMFHGRFTRNVNNETNGFSYSEYLEYRDHNQVFSGLLAYQPFIEASLASGSTQQTRSPGSGDLLQLL